MYGKVDNTSAAKFKVGDKLQITKMKWTFDKEYLLNWTEEIFTITEVINTKPLTYKLEDYGREKIEGSFYAKKIQRVVKTNNVLKIEKFLSTRKCRGVKEYLSSGKVIRKNSIRGLVSLSWWRVFKLPYSLMIIAHDMQSYDFGPKKIHFHRLRWRDSNNLKDWKVCGRKVPRSKLVFFSQVIIIYIVVCLYLFSLTTG